MEGGGVFELCAEDAAVVRGGGGGGGEEEGNDFAGEEGDAACGFGFAMEILHAFFCVCPAGLRVYVSPVS